MSKKIKDLRPFLKRVGRPWYAKLVLLLILVLGICYLVAPNRVIRIVSVDGLYKWERENAPPRYKIVWQPAEQ